MDNREVTLKVIKGGYEYDVILEIPREYKYKLNQSVLTVAKDFEPKYGHISVYYNYTSENFDSINESNYMAKNSNSKKVRNFDYKKEYIDNHVFKTFCTEYLDDNTINKTYIRRVNDDITGKVEIQKFGARYSGDYKIDEIKDFLSILVNSFVKDNEQAINDAHNEVNENNTHNNIDNNDISLATISYLVIGGVLLIVGILLYVINKNIWIVSIVTVILSIIFVLLFFNRLAKDKKN